MSSSGPPEGDPFENVPFLGDLARMLRSQGPVSWEAARQFAVQVATGGDAEPNVDPIERIRLEELGRVAELRVADLTGLPVARSGRVLTMHPVTRGEWARRTLDAWRPIFERLAQSLTAEAAAPEAAGPEEADDPTAQLMGGLMRMVAPMVLGMQAGSMAGHLAQRALGQYDLPVPRPESDELLLVPANIDDFGGEWSLPDDELRMWVCLHEVAHHSVLGIPHVRDRLTGLLLDYVGGFSIDPGGLDLDVGAIDPGDPASIQRVFADPRALLGAMQSRAQKELQPHLEALVVVVEGYVDHVMDRAGTSLIRSYGMLTEALHRRRVEATQADRFVESLLGLELGRGQYERGQAFVEGVVERGGPAALERLWRSPRELPTPAEVDAPGLWLARIDLPDH